jgi:RHS repeat-associated protein
VLTEGLLYDGQLTPVATLDADGNIVERFVYVTGVNVPGYMIKYGVTYRLIADHLGSVRFVVNVATGEVAQRLDYDVFGRVTLDSNQGFQPFGYAGGLYDSDTGLVRFRTRDYNSEIGIWTGKDSIGLLGGINQYTYSDNQPVIYYDPDGQSPSSSGIGDYGKGLLYRLNRLKCAFSCGRAAACFAFGIPNYLDAASCTKCSFMTPVIPTESPDEIPYDLLPYPEKSPTPTPAPDDRDYRYP